MKKLAWWAVAGVLLLAMVACKPQVGYEDTDTTTGTTGGTTITTGTLSMTVEDTVTGTQVDQLPANHSARVKFSFSGTATDNLTVPVKVTHLVDGANPVVQQRYVFIPLATRTATLDLQASQTQKQEIVEVAAELDGQTYTKRFQFTPLATSSQVAQVIVQLQDANGVARESFSITEKAQILIKVLDDAGQPKAGENVVLSTDIGTLSATSAITGADGTVLVTLNPPALSVAEAARTGVVTVLLNGTSHNLTVTFYRNRVTGLAFVSAQPRVIAVSGASASLGFPEQAVVTFQVTDFNGAPQAGERVYFKLKSSSGGAQLLTQSGVSDTQGNVSVTVKSGRVPGPLFIQAWVEDANGNVIAEVSSNEITVTTGVPVQSRFSISADVPNPEAWRYENVPVQLTVSLADMNGNPAREGTVVNFATEEGGLIDPQCQLDANGSCVVTWRSQFVQQRPQDHRVTVLAWAVGSETFNDVNGDWLYRATDDGAPVAADRNLSAGWAIAANPSITGVQDITEPWMDKNENGQREVDEPFQDYNGDGVWNVENGKYDGLQCADETAAECSGQLTFIRRAIPIVLSDSFAYITVRLLALANPGASNDCQVGDVVFSNNPDEPPTCTNFSLQKGGAGSASLLVTITDTAGQIMPAETDISIRAVPEFATLSVRATEVSDKVGYSSYAAGNSYVVSATTTTDGNTDRTFIEVSVTTPRDNKTQGRVLVNVE